MIYYKIDILKTLKEKGYSANFLRNSKILPESVMTRLRNDEPIGLKSLNTICILLDCDVSDLIKYKEIADEVKEINSLVAEGKAK